MIAAGEQDHADVIVRPPLLYLGALAGGLLLETALPLGAGLLAAPMSRVAIGIMLVVAGAALLGAATARFRRARTNIPTVMPALALVTSGPYAWSRNPIYIALSAVYAGLAVALNAWWAVIILPAVLATLRYGVIAREEAYLERKFPDQYNDYRARVRRWL